MNADAKRRVLIVEDHPTFADLMRQMMSLIGFEAIVAHDLAAARAVEAGSYAAVVCDYTLPDGTAADLLDHLDGRAVPVVLLSGYRECDLPADLAGRFDATLTKPVEMRQLKDVLGRLCGKQG